MGNNKSERLIDFLKHIELALGKKAIIVCQPMQQGDVGETYADITEAQRDFNFNPSTTIESSIPKFVDWFIQYNKNQHNI